MSNTQFTSGLWQTWENSNEYGVEDSEGNSVCVIESCNQIQDAQLIAAAPELFEALVELVKVAPIHHNSRNSDILIKAEAAIAKATRGV